MELLQRHVMRAFIRGRMAADDWRLFPFWNPIYRCSLLAEIRMRSHFRKLDRAWQQAGCPGVRWDLATSCFQLITEDSDPTLHSVVADFKKVTDSLLCFVRVNTSDSSHPDPLRDSTIAIARALDGFAHSATPSEWDHILGHLAALLEALPHWRTATRTPMPPPKPVFAPHRPGEHVVEIAIKFLGPGAAGVPYPLQPGYPPVWSVADQCLPTSAFRTRAQIADAPEGLVSGWPSLFRALLWCGVPHLFFDRVVFPSVVGSIERPELDRLVIMTQQIGRGAAKALEGFETVPMDAQRKADLRQAISESLATTVVRCVVVLRLLQLQHASDSSSTLRQQELLRVIKELLLYDLVTRRSVSRDVGVLVTKAAARVIQQWPSIALGVVPPTGWGELHSWHHLPPLDAEPLEALEHLLMEIREIKEN